MELDEEPAEVEVKAQLRSLQQLMFKNQSGDSSESRIYPLADWLFVWGGNSHCGYKREVVRFAKNAEPMNYLASFGVEFWLWMGKSDRCGLLDRILPEGSSTRRERNIDIKRKTHGLKMIPLTVFATIR
ncbi:uncharacterized protein LOC124203954 [Daphnia pulex]|uniref:uncharacterized protein LOC124203954 n=1 Tax=Daphnia pulex TaxID=6669 RepID=UPI001EDCCC7E|nr:uncharacterized protein LOC124203954 [Daphnia pulex]